MLSCRARRGLPLVPGCGPRGHCSWISGPLPRSPSCSQAGRLPGELMTEGFSVGNRSYPWLICKTECSGLSTSGTCSPAPVLSLSRPNQHCGQPGDWKGTQLHPHSHSPGGSLEPSVACGAQPGGLRGGTAQPLSKQPGTESLSCPAGPFACWWCQQELSPALGYCLHLVFSVFFFYYYYFL